MRNGGCLIPGLLFLLTTILSAEIRIVGGDEVELGDYPFMTAIVDAEYGYNLCGAALIHPGWVLTASHCVLEEFTFNPFPEDYLNVRINLVSMESSEGELVDVDSVIFHSDFSWDTNVNDIALLKLASQAETEPVKLVFENGDPPPGTDTTVMGWGLLSESGQPPDVLNSVTVPIVSNEDCNKPTAYSGVITETMLCAGYKEGQRDACAGDSGGPLVISKAGKYVQLGIVSWGEGCARPEKYGVYTRVSKYREWIAENTEGDVPFQIEEPDSDEEPVENDISVDLDEQEDDDPFDGEVDDDFTDMDEMTDFQDMDEDTPEKPKKKHSGGCSLFVF